MTKENYNVTIRDVANRAGVSVSTVSRVINEDSRVNAQMKIAVLKAQAELGYFQNSIARSLKTNSTYTIGFVASDISNTYLMMVARAIENLINKHQYNLLVCSTEDSKELELSYLKLLNSKNIDGLVLNGTGLNEQFILEMNKRIPTVLIHRRLKSPEFIGDLVDSDNEQGAYLLTKHMTQLGHKKILVIKGPDTHSNSLERLAGVRRAMKEINIDIDRNYPYIFNGNFFLESGYDAVEYLCRLPDRPTAIISFNTMMTIGALKCLKEKNINAPEDISIASTNKIEHIELMAIRPTVIDYDPKLLGAQAGEFLLERLNDNSLANRECIFTAKIIHGNAVSFPRD